MPKAIMVVQSRPSEPSREAEYNDWYDNTHIPELCEIPGIVSARRFALSDAQLMPVDSAVPKYVAIYELETNDIAQVLKEMGSRVANGTVHMTDAIELDPAPSVTIYELLK